MGKGDSLDGERKKAHLANLVMIRLFSYLNRNCTHTFF